MYAEAASGHYSGGALLFTNAFQYEHIGPRNRPKRADAQRDYDKLLEAAGAAFTPGYSVEIERDRAEISSGARYVWRSRMAPASHSASSFHEPTDPPGRMTNFESPTSMYC